MEVYFHNEEEPDWYIGTVQGKRTQPEGEQIDVYFESDETAAWLTIKDERIRYPQLPEEEEEAEGGGAMNNSDEEASEGDFN